MPLFMAAESESFLAGFAFKRPLALQKVNQFDEEKD